MRPVISLAIALLLHTPPALGTTEEGVAFLEQNKGREGVVTLKSGLQYKVLRKGSGKYAPKKDSSCECHYAGTTLRLTPDAIDKDESEWKEFDSSYKRGETTSFAPSMVIAGWTEAMQLMVEGDKWEMYIPSELGYGESGSGSDIKGGEMLIFRMEIIRINGGKKRIAKCDVKTLENCDAGEVDALTKYADWTLDQISKELTVAKEKLNTPLKKQEREKLDEQVKALSLVKKSKKKGKAEL